MLHITGRNGNDTVCFFLRRFCTRLHKRRRERREKRRGGGTLERERETRSRASSPAYSSREDITILLLVCRYVIRRRQRITLGAMFLTLRIKQRTCAAKRVEPRILFLVVSVSLKISRFISTLELLPRM